MDDIQQIFIPTIFRAKISHDLSYPIGAKDISTALAKAVQLPELKLHFYAGFDPGGLRTRRCEFLRAEYLNQARPSMEWPILDLYGRPPQSKWEIVVRPVPRVLRHQIKQYVLETALPRIAHWLGERHHLAQRGNDILAFFYDDKTEEFTPQTLTHLEPLRNRGR
jgi:hypothetical protein